MSKTNTKEAVAEKETEEVIDQEQELDGDQHTEKVSFGDLADSALEETEDIFSLSEIAEEEIYSEGEDDPAEAEKAKEDEPTKKDKDEKAEKEEAEGETGGEEKEDSEAEPEKAEKEDEEEDVDKSEPVAKIPDSLLESVKAINPDLDTNDPEAVATAINDLAKEKKDIEESLTKEREANQGFYDLLEGDENFRRVARMMFANEGMTVEEAISTLGIEPAVDMEKLKKEDPDKYLAIVEENRKKQEKMKELNDAQKAKEQKFKDNQDASFKNVDEFKKESDLDDDALDPVVSSLNSEIKNISEGLITKDLIATYHKGLQYEDKVKELEAKIEEAREEGRVEGRNDKIEGIKRKKKGDGLPDLSGAGKPQTLAKKEKDIFDQAIEEDPFDINNYID